MHEHIDIYCERTGPEFWSEPVNAITNLAFFIAAWGIFRLIRQSDRAPVDAYILLLLIFSIGTGSFLFHTFATQWAAMADVIPILLFQLVFLWSYARRVMGHSSWVALGLVGLFIVLTLLIGQLPQDWLNGSLAYLPVLLVLVALGFYHRQKAVHEPNLMLLVSLLFFVSLFFRTVDMAICGQFSLGIHFMWHCLNGIVLYSVMRALISNIKLHETEEL